MASDACPVSLPNLGLPPIYQVSMHTLTYCFYLGRCWHAALESDRLARLFSHLCQHFFATLHCWHLPPSMVLEEPDHLLRPIRNGYILVVSDFRPRHDDDILSAHLLIQFFDCRFTQYNSRFRMCMPSNCSVPQDYILPRVIGRLLHFCIPLHVLGYFSKFHASTSSWG